MLREHRQKKKDKYSVGSKEKLKAAIRHKIKRTFVGALDAIERELDEWDFSTKEKDDFMYVIRRKVLGVGNDQIRNMETELDKYNIEFIPYHIEFKVLEGGFDNEG
jgi:hypothetical protein